MSEPIDAVGAKPGEYFLAAEASPPASDFGSMVRSTK